MPIPQHNLSIALFEPEIPGNVGAIGRVCAATETPLHLIGRLGFSFQHPAARRAAMDYWQKVQSHRHESFDAFRSSVSGGRVLGFTTKAAVELWDVGFQPGDILLYGPESAGLPDLILNDHVDLAVRIPMVPDNRSLNLGTSVAIGIYEALRQISERPDDGAPRST